MSAVCGSRSTDGRLKCDAPPGVLDDGLRAQLAARKQELLTLIAEAEMTLGAPRSLVPLKPTGDHPPLFARPGHNGDVFCYRALAAHLDPHRPLYGVEPKGVDGSPTAETVEEIAEYEVAQIRRFQPDGPYYIAGYCAGGTIAFESARQLADAGEDVARVVLFGSPFPTVYRTGRVRRTCVSEPPSEAPHGRATAGSLAEGVEYIRSRARRAWPRRVSASIQLSRRTDAGSRTRRWLPSSATSRGSTPGASTCSSRARPGAARAIGRRTGSA